MSFFQKKPVVIEARQLTHDNLDEIFLWIKFNGKNRDCYRSKSISQPLVIQTLEGDHQATVGDWIIKGVKNEFYPCKPDIFEMTYEPCTVAVDLPQQQEDDL